MKKDYVAMKIELIFMESADVITTSATTTVAEFKLEWLNGFNQGGVE